MIHKKIILLIGLQLLIANSIFGQHERTWILVGTYQVVNNVPVINNHLSRQNLLLSFSKDSLLAFSLDKGLYRDQYEIANDSVYLVRAGEKQVIGFFKDQDRLWLKGQNETIGILKRTSPSAGDQRKIKMLSVGKPQTFSISYQDLFADKSLKGEATLLGLAYVGELRGEDMFHRTDYSKIFSINQNYYLIVSYEGDSYYGDYIFQIKAVTSNKLILTSYINGEHDVELMRRE